MAVPGLVPLLGHSNRSTRFSAGIALSGFGTNAAPAVPVIERLIVSEPDKTHDIMFHILETCGPEAKGAIPSLQKVLSSSNAHVRIQAARTLWTLDSSQAELSRTVARESLAAKDAGIRIESASLLWRMDKDTAAVVPKLIGLLNDDGHGFEYRTIRLLKQIGPGARDAIPAVTAWLKRTKRKEAFIHKATDEALQAMGSAAEGDQP